MDDLLQLPTAQPKRGRGRPRKAEIEQFMNKIESIDVSDQHVTKVARGYFVGNKAIGRRKDVRAILENRVVTKIGKEGKFLVDKLFELVEGVYMVDKTQQVNGWDEIKYYKVPPNLNAIIYALDRVLGKPKQVSIQGNFSLSQLLIGNGSGSNNNEADAVKSAIFSPGNLELDSTGSQEGV